MARPKRKEPVVRIPLTVNVEIEADLEALRRSGKFGQTNAESVRTVLEIFLFDMEKRGELDRFRVLKRRRRQG